MLKRESHSHLAKEKLLVVDITTFPLKPRKMQSHESMALRNSYISAIRRGSGRDHGNSVKPATWRPHGLRGAEAAAEEAAR